MHKSGQFSIKAKSIGSIALDVLSKDQDALIMSNISGGIFVKSSSRWLIFISFDDFNSPLTITFKETTPLLNFVQVGTTVYFASGQLLIPQVGVNIITDHSNVWKPALRQIPSAFHPDREKRLKYFAKEILRRNQGAGFSALLPKFLALSVEMQPISQSLIPVYENITLLQQYIRDKNLTSIGKILCSFLGFGEGLTPSGDDFVIGFLLSLNRWQDVLLSNTDTSILNQQVTETAYQNTTTLSANLIECAALGQADERLIEAIDFLMSGCSRGDKVMTNLLGWGNSSGVDAFVGMAVLIAAMKTKLGSDLSFV